MHLEKQSFEYWKPEINKGLKISPQFWHTYTG